MSSLSPDVALHAEGLLEKAAAQTGLSDFGDDSYREPYNILLQSLQDEACLNTPVSYTHLTLPTTPYE